MIEEMEETDGAAGRFLLRKSSRLHHHSLVEGLFSHGKSLYDMPLRLVYRALTHGELDSTFCSHTPDSIGELQVMITVPKKMRRHAVDRVLMRRRIREAFRLNSLPLRRYVAANPELRTLSLGFVYVAKENVPYRDVERHVCRLLSLVVRKLEKGSTKCAE